MESMQRLANAINRFAWRTEPSYPFRERPVVNVTGEPSVVVKPFRKQQIERMRSLTEGPLKEALSRHFRGMDFEVSTQEDFGYSHEIFALPAEPSGRFVSYITVSTLPSFIELNFKRSDCRLSRWDIGRYLAFVRDILGEGGRES